MDRLITPRFIKVIWMALLIHVIYVLFKTLIASTTILARFECMSWARIYNLSAFCVENWFFSFVELYILFQFTPKKIANMRRDNEKREI